MGYQTVLIIDNDGFSDFEKVAGKALTDQVRRTMNGSDEFYSDGPYAGVSDMAAHSSVGVMKAHPKHEAHVLIAEAGDLHDMHSSFVEARLAGASDHNIRAERERVEQLEAHAAAARAALEARIAARA